MATSFSETLENPVMLVVKFRAGVADTVDASDVVLDKLEALKDAGSSADSRVA